MAVYATREFFDVSRPIDAYDALVNSLLQALNAYLVILLVIPAQPRHKPRQFFESSSSSFFPKYLATRILISYKNSKGRAMRI